MRTTRIITVLIAALLTAAILAGPAAAVPTDVISGGSTSPDQGWSRSRSGERVITRTRWPAASSSGTSRPPM